MTSLPQPDDIPAPAAWTVSRSLVGTPDERLILIRTHDVDARYELYWTDDRLVVEAIRWGIDDAHDFGRFEYQPHRIALIDGEERTLSGDDEDAVLKVCQAESARFWRERRRERRQEIRNLLPLDGHPSS